MAMINNAKTLPREVFPCYYKKDNCRNRYLEKKERINCTFSVSVVAYKFKAIYNERKGGITYEIQIRRLYG